jgi:ATP-dependent Lon protease
LGYFHHDALECRRRVKEQQKRIGSAEFRNTHFSYRLGEDDVEQFITPPELQSGDQIGSDPLPPGQVWCIGPGGLDDYAGLYRVDVNVGPGSGVRILNQPAPPTFRESVRYAEQNLYAQAQALCGALLEKSLRGGLIAVGGLNLGGGIDPVYNAVSVAELAVEKGASALLIPISARRQLNELSDEMVMKLTILYYSDAREALIKALGEF